LLASHSNKQKKKNKCTVGPGPHIKGQDSLMANVEEGIVF